MLNIITFYALWAKEIGSDDVSRLLYIMLMHAQILVCTSFVRHRELANIAQAQGHAMIA